jgi:hypothetical protein
MIVAAVAGDELVIIAVPAGLILAIVSAWLVSRRRRP